MSLTLKQLEVKILNDEDIVKYEPDWDGDDDSVEKRHAIDVDVEEYPRHNIKYAFDVDTKGVVTETSSGAFTVCPTWRRKFVVPLSGMTLTYARIIFARSGFSLTSPADRPIETKLVTQLVTSLNAEVAQRYTTFIETTVKEHVGWHKALRLENIKKGRITRDHIDEVRKEPEGFLEYQYYGRNLRPNLDEWDREYVKQLSGTIPELLAALNAV